jgi:hypothetical protein
MSLPFYPASEITMKRFLLTLVMEFVSFWFLLQYYFKQVNFIKGTLLLGKGDPPFFPFVRFYIISHFRIIVIISSLLKKKSQSLVSLH